MGSKDSRSESVGPEYRLDGGTGVMMRKGVFLREATGLVREMNAFDVLAMNSFNISAGLGLAFVLFYGPSLFYNANIPVGVLLATLGGLCGALTFALLTAMVPRSVGDYVLVTRTLHPALGFATNWTWHFWNIAWAGILTSFVSNWALYQLFAIYGTLYDVPSYRDIAFNPEAANFAVTPGTIFPVAWTLFPQNSILNILIGTIIIAAFGVMLSVGPKVFLYFQRAVFTIGIVSLVVTLGIMLMATRQTFVDNWNTYATTWQTNPAQYADVEARAGGATSYANIIATIAIIPLASWSLAYGNVTTAVGGEIKRPTRNLPLGASLSVLMAGGIMAIGGLFFINVVGLDFISGSVNSYNAYYYGGETTGPWYFFYPAPFFDLWVSIVAPHPAITLLVGIGFICWIIYYPGLNILVNTRAVLAWSFDRVAPSALGKVSEKYHTPIRAVVLYTCLSWVALVIFSMFFTLVGSLTPVLATFLTMFLVMGIVGLVFPFTRKTKPIYQASGARWRVGPVPVLTIVSIGWLLFLFTGAYFYLTEGYLASNNPTMLTISAVVFFAAFPLYYLAKFYRQSRGVDIALAFKEIPPE